MAIRYNSPALNGNERSYALQALESGRIASGGAFTDSAEKLLSSVFQTSAALLTTSCTHALELGARALDLGPGDEIIVPSFTFPTTASSFLWNGASVRFADIRPDTQNIDLEHATSLINDRTRAICIVHYAGVGAQPDEFAKLCQRHGLTLIEDNAHGFGATYKGQSLGSFGKLSTLSFHETKNITCGEGGSLLVNDESLVEKCIVLRDKGTDRQNFLNGLVDKYTWRSNGSSYGPSEVLAAILLAQLEQWERINGYRVSLWNRYRDDLASWAARENVSLPFIPSGVEHPGHLFYLILPSSESRSAFLDHMQLQDIGAVIHYQDLASSPFGSALSTRIGQLPNSLRASQRLVRLPLSSGLTSEEQEQVIERVLAFRA